MEIDITEFFNNADPAQFSASEFELGRDAGKITWNAALACVDHQTEACEELLTTEAQVQAVRQYHIACGAERHEVVRLTPREVNALFLQIVSAEMREGDLHNRPVDWDEYRRSSEAGRVSGNIYSDGEKVWIYIGE